LLAEAVSALFVQQPQVDEDVAELEGLVHLELIPAAAVEERNRLAAP